MRWCFSTWSSNGCKNTKLQLKRKMASFICLLCIQCALYRTRGYYGDLLLKSSVLFPLSNWPNHIVERMLPMVNKRVNYLLKGALNLEDSMTRFCVSTLTWLQLDRTVQSWNAHRIQGLLFNFIISLRSSLKIYFCQDALIWMMICNWSLSS